LLSWFAILGLRYRFANALTDVTVFRDVAGPFASNVFVRERIDINKMSSFVPHRRLPGSSKDPISTLNSKFHLRIEVLHYGEE
jgi:hypothetical protein